MGKLSEYARLARMQYDEGYTPYLTVLYAQSQLFTAELNYSRTEATALSSYVRIYQAMGGGWVDIAGQLTSK
jgi:multidrug efflux system outer membrane protein